MELTVQNLVKQYPRKRALDDVSFLLREGVYGLLGPNGAGKTTLINTVEDLISKTGEDMMKVRNMGKKSLDEVQKKLEMMGLSLASEESGNNN